MHGHCQRACAPVKSVYRPDTGRSALATSRSRFTYMGSWSPLRTLRILSLGRDFARLERVATDYAAVVDAIEA
jgi:hypothetical protein